MITVIIVVPLISVYTCSVVHSIEYTSLSSFRVGGLVTLSLGRDTGPLGFPILNRPTCTLYTYEGLYTRCRGQLESNTSRFVYREILMLSNQSVFEKLTPL